MGGFHIGHQLRKLRHFRWLLLVFFIVVRTATDTKNIVRADTEIPKEYCQLETFQPRCWKNEMIIIKSALYGRMSKDRCIKAGFDYIGCSIDVLHLADRKCTGKSECNIRIPDGDFEDAKAAIPASDDDRINNCWEMTRHFEASYGCVKSVEDDRSCLVSVSTEQLYIAGTSTPKSSCGTHGQPWLLQAPAGQQIAFRLLDLTLPKSISNQLHDDGQEFQDCLVVRVGSIIERQTKSNISICLNGTVRETALYLTKSNTAEVAFSQEADSESGNENIHFLISFEAVGCSNLVPPSAAWLKRDGNDATIGCYTSRQTWHLKCRDNQWTGLIGACTQEVISHGEEPESKYKEETSFHALAIAATACIGMAICLGIICIGVACLKRYKKSPKYQSQKPFGNESECMISANRTHTNGLAHDQLGFITANGSSITSASKTHDDAVRTADYPIYIGTEPPSHSDAGTKRKTMPTSSQYFVLDSNEVAKENCINAVY